MSPWDVIGWIIVAWLSMPVLLVVGGAVIFGVGAALDALVAVRSRWRRWRASRA